MCRERACEPPYTSNPVARTKRSGQKQVGLCPMLYCVRYDFFFILFAARAGEASARGARGRVIYAISRETELVVKQLVVKQKCRETKSRETECRETDSAKCSRTII